MSASPLQVLLLEDVAMDAELIEFELEGAGLAADVEPTTPNESTKGGSHGLPCICKRLAVAHAATGLKENATAERSRHAC